MRVEASLDDERRQSERRTAVIPETVCTRQRGAVDGVFCGPAFGDYPRRRDEEPNRVDLVVGGSIHTGKRGKQRQADGI
jgi:hypothetical protein